MFGFEGVLDRVDAGLIVPVADVEDTAGIVLRLATDGAFRARLGQAALKRTQSHQLDRAMQVWLDLLDCA